jgi:hypothetical protein
MGCSAAFGLLKITLHVTKQEDLQGSSRPNGLLGCFWSAENYFARNKTGVFARLEQTKRAIFLHLVCFFAKKQTESRRSAQKKMPRAFPIRQKNNKKRPLPMALPTGAHSIKKRPALLQAERNFSRFR